MDDNANIPAAQAGDSARAAQGAAEACAATAAAHAADEGASGAKQPDAGKGPAEVARRADTMAARAYERRREHIMQRFADKDVARDIVTLGGMTETYCADHHDAAARVAFSSEAVKAGVYPARKIPRLCPECAAHLRYGEVRRALCRREPRPACKTCANHCYAPDESAWQKRAMAYAGPRAMFRGHARDAIRHLIQTKLK